MIFSLSLSLSLFPTAGAPVVRLTGRVSWSAGEGSTEPRTVGRYGCMGGVRMGGEGRIQRRSVGCVRKCRGWELWESWDHEDHQTGGHQDLEIVVIRILSGATGNTSWEITWWNAINCWRPFFYISLFLHVPAFVLRLTCVVAISETALNWLVWLWPPAMVKLVYTTQ